MIRNQTAILNKIEQYLDVFHQDSELVDYFEKNADGHCYAFSLIYAVMNSPKIAKLSWWQSALDLLLKWDGTTESIVNFSAYNIQFVDEEPSGDEIQTNTIFIINNSSLIVVDDKKDAQTSYQSFKHIDPDDELKQIFPDLKDDTRSQFSEQIAQPLTKLHVQRTIERIFNYISFNQGSLDDLSIKNNLIQTDFIKPAPDGNFEFEFNGEILRPKLNLRSAGYLTDDDLFETIKKRLVKDNICLAHNINHTCSFGLTKNNKWFFFDPNYKDGKAKKYIFQNKEDMIEEMIKRLGNSLCIEISSIGLNDNNQTLAIQKKDEPEVFLNLGLHMLSIHDSGYLKQLFDLAKDNPKLINSISEALLETDPDPDLDTGFQELLYSARDLLPTLFDLAKDHPKLINSISQALLKKNKNKVNGFETMINRASECLPKVFDLAKDHPILIHTISTALRESVDNCTGFNVLTFEANKYLPALFDLAKDYFLLISSISQALLINNSDKDTGFNILAIEASESLPALFDLANGQLTLISSISLALLKKNSRNNTGLNILAIKAGESLPTLFEFAKNNPAIISSIGRALLEKQNDSATGLNVLAIEANETLPALFDLAKNNPKLIDSINQALLEKDKDGDTGLNVLAIEANETLPALFELSKSYPKLIRNFSQALIEKNNSEETGFEMFVTEASELLPTLFDLAEEHHELSDSISMALKTKNKDGECFDIQKFSQEENLDKEIIDRIEQFLKLNEPVSKTTESTNTNRLFNKKDPYQKAIIDSLKQNALYEEHQIQHLQFS